MTSEITDAEAGQLGETSAEKYHLTLWHYCGRKNWHLANYKYTYMYPYIHCIQCSSARFLEEEFSC